MSSLPNFFMQEALNEAKKSASLGEVPVGAVVVVDGEIISRAHNEVETSNDASAHAEVLAIRRASEKLGRWRLDDASLYVTLEPCSMCIGAILLSRISKLYFGAYDSRLGAVGSRFDLSNYPGMPTKVEVFPELLKDESEKLLKDFFDSCRNK